MYDSFKTNKTLKIGKKSYVISSLKEAEKHGLLNISYLPFSIKVLLENLNRNGGCWTKFKSFEAVLKRVELSNR